MQDEELLERINQLVEEEHSLYEHSKAGVGLSADDEERLRAVEVALDQCWDLLRQRRGLRHRGQDPDLATVRDPETVENYEQ